MKPLPLFFLLAIMSHAQNYTATRTSADSIEVIRLSDAARKTEVSIVPSLGNNAYQMRVNGKNLLWAPYGAPAELKAKPAMGGNPFLAPWANRLDHDGFFANGKPYVLNAELKNFRRDQNGRPIHGLLVYSPYWRVVSLDADSQRAAVTSRLEFWKHPDLVEQFPFAHTIEMTYRLRDGALEVETAIENQAAEPMPVSLGYHTYYQLHDSPRDQWKVRVGARERLTLSNLLIPTGERKPVSLPDPLLLQGTQLDDVFAGLVRDTAGRAAFSVEGRSEKITVLYGPKYTVSVVYAPPGRGFICFEPMSGITNSFNLAHAGLYHELQTIPPGGQWKESFWIQPSGF